MISYQPDRPEERKCTGCRSFRHFGKRNVHSEFGGLLFLNQNISLYAWILRDRKGFC